MTVALCNMCCSSFVNITYDMVVDGRVLDQYCCGSCGYTWYIDNHPAFYPTPQSYVTAEVERLQNENVALQAIINDLVVVIDNLVKEGKKEEEEEEPPMAGVVKRDCLEQKKNAVRWEAVDEQRGE